MCSGGGKSKSVSVPEYKPPKVDPVPTTVQASDTPDAPREEQRKRRGRASTMLAEDRGAILGAIANAANKEAGVRKTLG
ncbi:hypothetical protein TAMA11512_12960 [Selenomonas sp. TAMA-11512]|uniref:hypothetical protein n=1 Tax=Selenomonas sp. TAMA-11512 TaxID=3095337 RepID=UPI0030900C0D|nr:hypothetical protein TAMA11512_12960 [Selenomonas sp. TAMA-11512]